MLTLGLVLGACGDDTGHHSDAGSGSDGDSGSAAIDAAPRVAPDLDACREALPIAVGLLTPLTDP